MTATVTATTTEETEADNPWGRRHVTVAVRNEAAPSRNVAVLVEEALAYWNGEGREYADYDVTFVPSSNADKADVVVEFVGRIESCDGSDTDSTVGCAPLLGARTTPSDPTRVQVVAGYSNESTVEILKHEFGHVVGVEHGEEPTATMRAMSAVTYLSQPDLRDRAVPWRNSTLAVNVDVSALPDHDREEAREQIRHALDYYESGADGAVPSNVSFVAASNRSAADLRIRVPEEAFDCGGERLREGSCGESWVYDTDTDDAPEYFAEYEIRVRGIDTDAIGWHVGYWLSDAMGLYGDELPEPFVDGGDGHRRNDWWE
ncbi:matrixin family metalloprotease [Halorussus salinus]|uniref:matrixin family metalloprotease n=1 Tax=Halorussus salinus TaxID=1364935 RepID=UPI0010921DB4|nr:matrixin family metalloprotease [Halorussus salinus]